ncbi:MAG: ThuA domain-containing protein [Actinomycetota bacterium]|nr:ThuA domain-containing protein [Actinomycetota bacterium]
MPRVLLFTKTTGYRHESIPAGVAALRELARDAGVELDHSEDGGVFTETNLGRYEATVWLDVTGDVLDEEQRAALAAYLRGGGGFAGIHSASDAEWSWPEFDGIVGARFLSHPNDDKQFQTAELRVLDRDHPSTDGLPDPWGWTDEWYVFTTNPSERVEVLLEVDESTYDPDGVPMGPRHPISWHGRFGAGRTWYTALGHLDEHFADPRYRAHLWGGVGSVLRA